MNNEKIFEKLDQKLLTLEKPSEFLNYIKPLDIFKKSNFGVIGKLDEVEQEIKYHPEGNVWNHICMVVDFASVAKIFASNKRVFMWGALLHDLGKITTTVKRKGKWTSYNHDAVGCDMVRELLSRESNDKEFNEKVCELVKFHMHHIYILKKLPFGNTNELIKTKNINDIILLFACDKLGRGNQNNKDKDRIFNELISILEILENKSGEVFNVARANIMEFRDLVIKSKEVL